MFVEVLYQIRTCPKLLRWIVALVFVLWIGTWHHPSRRPQQSDQALAPLVQKHIDQGSGHGGRWYIPPSWTDNIDDPIDNDLKLRGPQTPTEAATLALGLAMRKDRFLANTKIPLIIHQTWKSLESHTWSDVVRDSVNQWLEVAEGGSSPDTPPASYIMWDDDGVEEFMKTYENSSWAAIAMMPYKVERADVFRVAVLKWFGGVYADVDTKPLKHPSQWIQKEDLRPWIDPTSKAEYTLHEPNVNSQDPPDSATQSPAAVEAWANTMSSGFRKVIYRNKSSTVDVAAIVGIEADNPADKDDYWRMGYSYALQLTNWAMAMAPQHPIATHYLTQVTAGILQNATRLKEVEILDLTGPPAFTKAVKTLCESEDPSFRWESLSSRADPPNATGRIAAGDVMVLPITGFSPGRANLWPHKSMGSQPLDHPQARLYHHFAGSWRHGSASGSPSISAAMHTPAVGDRKALAATMVPGEDPSPPPYLEVLNEWTLPLYLRPGHPLQPLCNRRGRQKGRNDSVKGIQLSQGRRDARSEWAVQLSLPKVRTARVANGWNVVFGNSSEVISTSILLVATRDLEPICLYWLHQRLDANGKRAVVDSH